MTTRMRSNRNSSTTFLRRSRADTRKALRLLRCLDSQFPASRTLHVRATRTNSSVRLALRHTRNIVVFRSAKATHFRGAKGDDKRGATRRGHCPPARRRRADLLLREVGSGKQTAEIKHACDVRLGTRATTAKVRKVKWEACEAHRFECHERCRLSFIFRSAGLPHHARFDHVVRVGRGARVCATECTLGIPVSCVGREPTQDSNLRPVTEVEATDARKDSPHSKAGHPSHGGE
jgi:hypothetical protein